MKRFALLTTFYLALAAGLSGCGDGGGNTPSSYVGSFKSMRTNTGASITVEITQDDGENYTGMLATFPVSAKWGEVKTDALGLTSYQLVKGNDTNFFDFGLTIGGSTISGTVIRQ